MIKQVRRLQSITRGLRKPHPAREILQAEWHACLRDTSFDGSFIQWCMSQPELGPPPWFLPSLDHINMIAQLARHETDSKLHQDHKRWLDKTAYMRQLDQQQGNKQAFSMLKQFFPPVTELHHHTQQTGVAVQQADQAEVFVENASAFDPDIPVSIANHHYHILSQTSHSITITPSLATDDDVAVTQEKVYYTAPQMAEALNKFWNPYWNVPSPDQVDEQALQEAIARLPDLGLQDLNIDDPLLWQEGIRRLKSSSAKGVDAISAAELKQLPTQAIDHLRALMCRSADPFPAWMMLARTYAVPKHAGQLSPKDVRPITVLSQLFRLWGQILTRAIIHRIAPDCPSELTGFMPGRSAMDASYKQQRLIERSRESDIAYAGCSMDLVKCFNTIRRKIPIAALRKLGVPPPYLDKWGGSLQHLQRTWCLGETVSLPFSVNNGLCEGDPFSVVGMISLGFLWIQSIREHDTISDINSYADNWSWASVRPAAHQRIAVQTQKITQLAGMIVDWNKSWIWATEPSQLAHLRAAIQAIAGPVVVKQLVHEMELGCIMLYRGCHRLGKFRSRLAEAKRRLKVLAQMPHDCQTKVHLLRAGIYTQVAYGTELMPLGTQHLDQLRVQACEGLLGSSHSRNSAVALASIPQIMDPEIYVTYRAIRAAKRYLARASPREQDEFLRDVSSHSGTWSHCKGPAGSLKCYLLRQGWLLDPQGHIQVSAHVRISLVHTGMPTIQKWLMRNWQEHLLTRFCSRKELKGVQPMAIVPTRQVLQKFRAKDLPQLVAEISGSFQTAAQQSKWNESEGLCQHCQSPDSRFHRVYECPVLQDLRPDYANTLAWFLDQGTLAHEMPIVHQHEDEEWIRTWQYSLETPDISADVFRQIRTADQEGHTLTFYTDGSCQHSNNPTTRHAGFACVFDMTLDTQQQLQAVDFFRATGQMPKTLQTLIATPLQGEQDIHRAELAAVVFLCERFDNTHIYCDSQITLHLTTRCSAGEPLSAFAMTDHLDLVTRLWIALQRGSRIFHKIKAHDNLAEIPDSQLYPHLGNKQANDAAIEITQHATPFQKAILNKHHNEVSHYQTKLEELFKFHLTAHRVRALANVEAQGLTRVHTPARQVDRAAILNYTVAEPWSPAPIRVHRLGESAVGSSLATSILRWSQGVKWPSEPKEDPIHELGITWIELALSYMHHSQLYLPLKRPDQAGTLRLIFPATHAEAVAHECKLSEVSEIFSILFNQVAELVDSPIMPSMPKQTVRSLYVQGALGQQKGFAWRPEVPCQDQMIATLDRFLRKHRAAAFDTFPVIHLQPDPALLTTARAESIGDWNARCQHARIQWRKMKQLRRQLVGQAPLRFG